jgi:2-polyprenyl-3-methyl-5-hydroxy-6-metoxy-1,4-benzoquinol methylase
MSNKNYSSDWIKKLENQTHWMYYWHQLEYIRKYASLDDKILEIGVGSGFTSSYLKSKGYNVTTIDIDKEKKPDIVASIIDYKFDEKYDIVLAFEVFEHIPYDDFKLVLENLSKICTNFLIVSLPRNRKVRFIISVDFKIFKIKDLCFSTRRNKIITKNHFWEIEFNGYSKKSVVKDFKKNRFNKVEEKKYLTLNFFVFEVI